jgi:hypothetical protein
MLAKFPKSTMPPLDLVLQDHDIISYAYLYKNLVYPEKFSPVWAFEFNGKTLDGYSGFTAKYNSQR